MRRSLNCASARRAAAACLVSTMVACSGAPSAPTSTAGVASSQAANLALEIYSVTVLRWAASGAYEYTVTYRVHNTLGQAMTVGIMDAALLGPSGETLNATIDQVRKPAPETVGADLYSSYHSVILNDTDASHPFGENVHLRVSYQGSGATGIADAMGAVLHGPQTARLMDFALSTLNVQVGQSITARWSTLSAKRVVLTTAIAWDLNDKATSNFDQEVELSGSRTFTVRRTGVVLFELNVDNGLIDQQLTVVPQPH